MQFLKKKFLTQLPKNNALLRKAETTGFHFLNSEGDLQVISFMLPWGFLLIWYNLILQLYLTLVTHTHTHIYIYIVVTCSSLLNVELSVCNIM